MICQGPASQDTGKRTQHGNLVAGFTLRMNFIAQTIMVPIPKTQSWCAIWSKREAMVPFCFSRAHRLAGKRGTCSIRWRAATLSCIISDLMLHDLQPLPVAGFGATPVLAGLSTSRGRQRANTCLLLGRQPLPHPATETRRQGT
jgi:hypothetical protein